VFTDSNFDRKFGPVPSHRNAQNTYFTQLWGNNGHNVSEVTLIVFQIDKRQLSRTSTNSTVHSKILSCEIITFCEISFVDSALLPWAKSRQKRQKTKYGYIKGQSRFVLHASQMIQLWRRNKQTWLYRRLQKNTRSQIIPRWTLFSFFSLRSETVCRDWGGMNSRFVRNSYHNSLVYQGLKQS